MKLPSPLPQKYLAYAHACASHAFTEHVIRGHRKNEGNLNFKLIDYEAPEGYKYG